MLASCGGKNDKAPDDLLSKEEMVRILVDVHIAEAKVTQKGLVQDSAKKIFTKSKLDILNKYHVKPEVFERSFDYYMKNLKDMDDIYASVVDSLSFLEARGKLD
jgi:hypothetical protein